MRINEHNYKALMKELEEKQSGIATKMITAMAGEDNSDLLKEHTATSNLLKLMIAYKQLYMDEQPPKKVKEPKAPKEPKESKKKKNEEKSYGIMGLLNK
jgi:hypothetical protein